MPAAVKVQFFGNLNQFREDSAGVLFFSSAAPLACYSVVRVLGFVDELLLGVDPEHLWKDSFRASRISNEERELTLYTLSGRIRREVGCKVQALGGNSVLAYRHEICLEGGKGSIVVRGYGTACLIRPLVIVAAVPKTPLIDMPLSPDSVSSQPAAAPNTTRRRRGSVSGRASLVDGESARGNENVDDDGDAGASTTTESRTNKRRVAQSVELSNADASSSMPSRAASVPSSASAVAAAAAASNADDIVRQVACMHTRVYVST
jgi:hypothetical protein